MDEAGPILNGMNEPEEGSAPPILPQRPPETPPSSSSRYLFVFAMFVLAGVFIFGGWILSSFKEFTNSMALPAQNEYTEVTLRAGDPNQRIQVIDVQGIITSYGPANMVAEIKTQLKMARADKRVKAVIIRIDSPGGEVMASDEIARAIREFAGNKSDVKPVIASMGGMAASGGYYVAAPCNYIFANKLTITGSIGVIMQSVNFHGLMDKVGVKPVTYKSGDNKDMLSAFNPPEEVTDEQKKILQDFIDETYVEFLQVVRDGRDTNGTRTHYSDVQELASDWEEYADGRILTGQQAFNLGMVDQVGNFDDAIEFTESHLNLKAGTMRVITQEPPLNLGGIFRLLGKAEEKGSSGETTLKVDLGLSLPQIKPGVPYYLSHHLYAD